MKVLNVNGIDYKVIDKTVSQLGDFGGFFVEQYICSDGYSIVRFTRRGEEVGYDPENGNMLYKYDDFGIEVLCLIKDLF